MNLSIFQTPEWEKFKLETGYQKSHHIGDILVLQRELPLGRTMLYSPMVSQSQANGVGSKEFLDKIKKIGEENNAVFYRLELDIDVLHPTSYALLETFKKSFEEMQPENNWVVDVSQKEEDILAGMKQKGRYNIKLAQKNNIEITSSESAGKELDIFYELYSKTGKRKRVTFRAKAYFEKLLDILGKIGYARVYTATSKIEGKTVPLAAAVIIFYGEEALYLYGGSSDKYRNLMAPYLLHWQIMQEAKKRGMKKYNFLGIAPTDDPKHPWAGITRFKQQFGGKQEDILGSYDLVIKPFEYQIFKTAERIRRR